MCSSDLPKENVLQKRGKLLSHKACSDRFGRPFLKAERRVNKINRTYSKHPLSSPDGLSYSGVIRGFNNGRLDRGGRLYGDWQLFSESKRLQMTINEKPVVEIDIKIGRAHV